MSTKTNSTGNETEGTPTHYVLPATEFDSICEQLKETTHAIINAWAMRDDADCIDEALVKLHAARRNLETAVEVQS